MVAQHNINNVDALIRINIKKLIYHPNYHLNLKTTFVRYLSPFRNALVEKASLADQGA